MKIRTSFVSNSSSSSFVIGYNPAKLHQCPHCGRSDKKPEDFFQEGVGFEDDNQLKWIDPQQYLKKLQLDVKECDKYDREYYQELLTKLENFIPRWQTVIGCSISYHDTMILEELQAMKNNGVLDFYKENDE